MVALSAKPPTPLDLLQLDHCTPLDFFFFTDIITDIYYRYLQTLLLEYHLRILYAHPIWGGVIDYALYSATIYKLR